MGKFNKKGDNNKGSQGRNQPRQSQITDNGKGGGGGTPIRNGGGVVKQRPQAKSLTAANALARAANASGEVSVLRIAS